MKNKWIIAPPCSACTGACCRKYRAGVDFAVFLSEKEASGRFKNAKVETQHGPALPFDTDGNCIYLKNNLCSIYQDRPDRCSLFNCLVGYNLSGPGDHSDFLKHQPEVLELVQITLA